MSETQRSQASGSGKSLEGIGGWLVLLGIGQVLGPLQVLRSMIEEYSGLPEGTFELFPAALLGEAVLQLAFIGFLIYTAVLFFNKRAAFPKMFIISYAAALLLPFVVGIWVTITSGINTLANLASGEFLGTYAASVVIGAIWVSYVLNSERVRNTFVR